MQGGGGFGPPGGGAPYGYPPGPQQPGAPGPYGGYGAPPPGGQGYGPPPGGGPPWYPGGAGPTLTPVAAQVLTPRSSATVIVLTLVTCGIYGYIWLYKSSDELRAATGDQSINPTTDLLLSLVTCGIWYVYAMYRNTKKYYDVFRAMNVPRDDKSTLVLICALFIGILAPYFAQEEHNALCRLARGERV
jgi:hypothetical protein